MGAMKRIYTERILGVSAPSQEGRWDYLKGMSDREFRDRLKSQPKRTKREAEIDRQLGMDFGE